MVRNLLENLCLINANISSYCLQISYHPSMSQSNVTLCFSIISLVKNFISHFLYANIGEKKITGIETDGTVGMGKINVVGAGIYKSGFIGSILYS